MKADAFALWMQPKYTDGSVSSRVSRVRRVEAAYGDLDTLYDQDRLAALLEELAYSTSDEKSRRPNPTRIEIGGELHRQLRSLKNAVSIYRAFRDEGGEAEAVTEAAIEAAGQAFRERREGRQFELERHLQQALRSEIVQLEPGLTIIDGGDERAVDSGFIDILAQDANGAMVVIELKRDLARREAIGQILGYMGDLMAEEPGTAVRGIIVAGDFDKSCLGAVRAASSLRLVRYRFDFAFEPVDVSETALLTITRGRAASWQERP